MFKALAISLVATTAVAHAGNGTNLTKFVSDDTQMVLALDVAASRSAALIKDSYSKLLDAQPDTREKFAMLGIDPLKDVDTVFMAFGGFTDVSAAKDTASMVIIVEGRIKKDSLTKRPGATKSTHAGVDVYTKDDDEIALIDGKLYFTKAGKMPAQIDLVKGKTKNSLAASAAGKDMRETIKRANTKSNLWFALQLPAENRKTVAQVGIPVTAVSLGLKFSADVDAGLRVETPSDADAQKSLGTLNVALPQVQQMLGGIGLAAAGKTIVLAQDKAAVTATMKMTSTELKALFAMLGEKKAEVKTAPPPSPAGGLMKK